MAKTIQNTPNDDVLLKIEDLHVQYDTDDAVVHALNGFHLTLHRGEKLGLVGETGAGKTTMALSVLRLLPSRVGKVTQGSITYDGIDILHASAKTMLGLRGARISMIFQDPMTSLNPVTTVGDQILEVLKFHFPEMTEEEKNARVDDIMKMVGIPPARKHEYPHQFSGGMKQRIVIAMALIAEPELLLADEPTTALDVTIQAQILELMKQLKEKFNSAMVLITHDLGVVAEIADRVIILYSGRKVEEGSIETIFAKPLHPYTVGLMKAVPNVDEDDFDIQPIPGTFPNITEDIGGCRFHPRCPYATERCRTEVPAELEIEPGHTVCCHKVEEERGK